MVEIEYFRFEPGAMSIIQMGEELIGHPTTALSELVKNAYDADSLYCEVYIHLDKNPKNSFLVVIDNGLGMSDKVLFGEWLQPSMSSKWKNNKKSLIYKRNFLGSKGIGRLAAMALGNRLTVISKIDSVKEFNWICLNRRMFHKKDVLLKQIQFPGGKISKNMALFEEENLIEKRGAARNEVLIKRLLTQKVAEKDKGTIIVIEELDDAVINIISDDFSDAELPFEYTSFTMAFSTLTTPLSIIADSQKDLLKHKIIGENFFHKVKEDKFEIRFGINLYIDSDNGKANLKLIEPLPILKNFDYRVFGIVKSDGSVSGCYLCQRLGENLLNQEFNLTKEFVFSEEKRRKRKLDKNEEEQSTDSKVGKFYFDLRIYDRDVDAIIKMQEILKQRGRFTTRSLMDILLGLRISKNGFGVKPYGEEVKDWLELGQMRVQDPTRTIGPNQILGYIFLSSPDNDNLNEKTNREGFFESRAFKDLKRICRAILIDLGRRRQRFRLEHNLGRTAKSRLARPDTKEYLNYIASKTSDKQMIKKAERFVKDITTTLDNLEYTLTFSERLASLGSGLELVYHELAQPLTQLGGTEYSLNLKKEKIKDEKLREKFIEDINNLSVAVSALDNLKKSLQPAIGISKPKKFYPGHTFQKICVLFNKEIHDKEIKIKQDGTFDTYEIKDYEYALWIALLNIINNAVYWLSRSEEEKIICFSIEKENTLCLSNTGPKISDDALEDIFEYGVTMKQEKNATGLGLTFTRNILGSHGWEIWAENRNDGPAFLMRKKVKK
ncbi:ATP-binding protein [bacterium]|nr:ATP-binding protein [bacterium]MBU4510869.1 ATP-binding protein [bacterium]